jgi:general secretion pathway protein I
MPAAQRVPAEGGFTLVEVLVALMIIALGLSALLTAVSGTARASGYLREKALAQWIALNRVTEVRLNLQQQQLGQSSDTGELDYANRKWHYDTRYFDTNSQAMRRVIVRVWAGNADTKGNPLAECSGFIGTSIATPGSSNSVYAALGAGPQAPITGVQKLGATPTPTPGAAISITSPPTVTAPSGNGATLPSQ